MVVTRFDPDDLAILSSYGPGVECEREAELAARAAASFDKSKTTVDDNPMQAHLVKMQKRSESRPVWQISDNVPLFTMVTLAKAADVPLPTIRAWFQREQVTLIDGDLQAPTKGAARKFTLRSVLVIATMAELVRLGTNPSAAFTAAEHWMVHGVLEGQYGAPARREGGGLFPKPFQTYLVIGTDDNQSTTGEPCRIVAVDPHGASAYSTIFNALFFRGRGSAKIIHLNRLDRRVRRLCYETILGPNAPKEPDWNDEIEQMATDDTV